MHIVVYNKITRKSEKTTIIFEIFIKIILPQDSLANTVTIKRKKKTHTHMVILKMVYVLITMLVSLYSSYSPKSLVLFYTSFMKQT